MSVSQKWKKDVEKRRERKNKNSILSIFLIEKCGHVNDE